MDQEQVIEEPESKIISQPPKIRAHRALTPRLKKFAELVASGMPNAAAYRQAGYNPSTNESADANAWQTLQRPLVAKYLSDLREVIETAAVLSLVEKRKFLAQAVRTPISQIDENSPLAQEVTRKLLPTADGGMTEEKKIKAVSKLAAIELDNKMAGHNFQDNTDNSKNPFQFTVTFNLNSQKPDEKSISIQSKNLHQLSS